MTDMSTSLSALSVMLPRVSGELSTFCKMAPRLNNIPTKLMFMRHNSISHYTFEKSKGKEMVVDIQGSGYTYTDPQLHSLDKSYGRADRGQVGFDKFFSTHKCNAICMSLGLKEH